MLEDHLFTYTSSPLDLINNSRVISC